MARLKQVGLAMLLLLFVGAGALWMKMKNTEGMTAQELEQAPREESIVLIGEVREVIPGRVTIEVLEGQYENLTRTGKENHIEGTGYPIKMGEAGDIKPKAIVYVEGVKLGDTSVKPDKVVILTEYARIGE